MNNLDVTDNTAAPAPALTLGSRPNPFNPATTINYSVPQPGHVRLSVYNIRGQRVATLVNDHLTAGEHSVQWRGVDDSGRPVAGGVYLCRLSVGKQKETRKLLLLK